MKKYTVWFIVLFALGLSLSCQNKHILVAKKQESAASIISVPSQADSYSQRKVTRDSVYYLSFPISRYKGEPLTSALAKTSLYKQLLKKGIINYPEFDSYSDTKRLTFDYENAVFVNYDTILIIDINHNKYPDAIISYWLGAYAESSQCLQPTHALILDTDNGYKIFNEDIVPENFPIDRVVSRNKQIIIYTYDYYCGNDLELGKCKFILNCKRLSSR